MRNPVEERELEENQLERPDAGSGTSGGGRAGSGSNSSPREGMTRVDKINLIVGITIFVIVLASILISIY